MKRAEDRIWCQPTQKSWKLEFGQISCQKDGCFYPSEQNKMRWIYYFIYFFLFESKVWFTNEEWSSPGFLRFGQYFLQQRNLPCRLWNMLYYLIIKQMTSHMAREGETREAKVYSSSRCMNEKTKVKTISVKCEWFFYFLVRRSFFFNDISCHMRICFKTHIYIQDIHFKIDFKLSLQ